MKEISIAAAQKIGVDLLASFLKALGTLHVSMPLTQFSYALQDGMVTDYVYKIDLADGRSVSLVLDTATTEPGAKFTTTDKWKIDELVAVQPIQLAVVELIKASKVTKIIVKW